MDDFGNLAGARWQRTSVASDLGVDTSASPWGIDAFWLAALPCPAAVFDAQGSLATANARFHERFCDHECAPSLSAFLARFEGLEIAPERLSQSDGTPGFHTPCGHWFLLHVAALQEERRLLTAIDLSERAEALRGHREMQEQLLFSSRVMSLGEMTTTLAHELNQPLATIINYLSAARSLLERPLDRLDEEARTLLVAGLGEALLQTEHAAAVVARIREFVRARQPVRAPHDLAASIQRVLQLQRLDAHERQVRLHTEVDPGLPMVLIDRVMVEQVLANLIRNAIEAMDKTPPPEREIRISVRRNLDKRAEVRVADRGPGLCDQDGSQLFTPFFTTKANGMGVGLSICRSIVEYHEGSLYAEPNGERGLSFVFTLPLVSTHESLAG